MMRKKIVSLCMALVLCLGLLPVTALAADNDKPNNLYVGNQNVKSGDDTTYWATTDSGELKLVEGASDTSNNWNVKYDPNSATLTLKNATIEGGYDDVNTSGAGIYAASSSGPVSLNIVLEEENKVSGWNGINVSSGGDASLNISGSGSLTVSATATNGIGIFVQAQSGNANLAINGANVNAVVTETNGRGVELSTGQAGNPNLTIEVKGGSLQASGQPNGIKFFTNADNTRADANLKVSGNAMVKTSGITTDADGSGSQGAVLTTEAGSGETGGIVFDGSAGTVYGAVTLQENLTVGEGESLTLDDGASLNAGDYDVIVDGGTLDEGLAESLDDSVIYKVTKVELNKTSLTLDVGNSDTLIAAITPDNATDKSVTWESSAPGVATVDTSGKVTAVAPGTATITATTEDGSKTATCVVTVTAATVPVTGVTLSQTQASLYYNRTPNTLTLTATVAPDNATNQAVTWTSSNPSVAKVENGVVTALARGTAVITATAADGSGANATCTVTVSRYSSGGGSSSSSPSLSDRAIDDIQDARPGDTVEITLRPGRTTLEREVFEELAGQDITLEIDAGDGVLWTVNGLDIPEDTRLHDLDLDVDLGDSGIPATVLNAVTGEIDTVQLSLAHDGRFGFTMTLSAPLGRDNADYWANLYWYNEETEELEFQQAARIAKDGTAEFALDHASDYAIVIDDRSHEPVDLPFNDVPEGYWAYDAIQYVYGEGLMAGTSGSAFSPEGTTTRGQIVTILWRLAGSPVVNYLMDFDDVDPAAYYAEAIRWATSEGIAGGYGGGVFGPDDPITREQLAVMLHRYAQHQGCDVSIGEDTNILSYADAFDVSEYAVSALQWACGAGIISGTGDGSTLTPQGEATRAQAATVLMRFCEEYQ